MASRGSKAVLLIALLALVGAGASGSATKQQVTVFGDSILTAVLWNEGPMKTLQSGFDVRMEIGVCRRTVGESCPFEGGEVTPLVDRVRQMAAGKELAPTVVVESGYNDFPDTFPAAVETALTTLRDAGVKRVIWPTLVEAEAQYIGMNRVLRDAATRHPELTIVDWNAYSHNHWGWFQSDAKHLRYDGAVAYATMLHTALVASFAPPLAAARLPQATAGRPYSTSIATGGVRPYHVRVLSGRLPRGFHLLADGRLSAEPRRAGVVRFTVQIVDAADQALRVPVELRVR